MRVMGLDLSTQAGAAVVEVEPGKLPQVITALEIKAPKGTMGMRRCGAIAQGVLELLAETQPNRIYIEDYAPSYMGSAIVNIEIGAIVRYFLAQEGADYFVVSPTTLKKFATGNGGASKDVVIKEVFKRWNYDTNSNNVADAVALGMFGLAAEGLITLPKNHMDAVHTWMNPKPKPKKKTKK